LAAQKTSDMKYRLLGFLPVLFFLAQAIHYWRINELGHLFWMCNVGNLLLAVGLFLEKPALVRVAAIWMIPGLIIWLVYVVMAWGIFFSSTLAHVGGLVVGMVAIRKFGMDRRSWLYAFGWYLLVQLLSRLLTPAALNVNLAYRMQAGWDQTFGAYWQFWLTLTLAVAFSLWLIGLTLWRIYPPRDPASQRL
jgi:hypothetical protein